MIGEGAHLGYILFAWAGAALCVAGLILHTAWDARRRARRLAVLEARGIRRGAAEEA